LLLVRTTLFLGCALCLMAQNDTAQPDSSAGSGADYGGPAILSRGELPTAAQGAAEVAFRPYIGLSGIYDTGLLGVGVTSTGEVPSTDLYGVELNLGAYAYRTWKRTTLSLDYRGDLRHYSYSAWDATDQFLTLTLTHRPTKRGATQPACIPKIISYLPLHWALWILVSCSSRKMTSTIIGSFS
jgi:hypothetical protein